jgi:hypothetical protein
MEINRKERLGASLPPTPCTQDMREQIVALAKNNGATIAEVQRTAFEFFLRSIDSKTIAMDSKAISQ